MVKLIERSVNIDLKDLDSLSRAHVFVDSLHGSLNFFSIQEADEDV